MSAISFCRHIARSVRRSCRHIYVSARSSCRHIDMSARSSFRHIGRSVRGSSSKKHEAPADMFSCLQEVLEDILRVWSHWYNCGESIESVEPMLSVEC
jgi:hypothetical protein